MSDKYIILVVDDDEALRKLYTEYLTTTGLHVDSAATGAEAAEKLQGHAYDLVLIDLKLPDMNGIELLKLVRKNSPDTIPVILSGHATIELTIEAISLGAFDFLLKPVQLPRLSVVIQNGLERRRILLQNKKLISELQIAKQNLEAGIRQRTEQLKKSEQKFRTLYDNAPDVYYTVDTRGRIIDCNKMATEFFGCTRRELKAKHLLDLYTSDNFELVSSMVPTPDGQGGKVRHQEVTVKRSDGSVACVEINSNMLYDSDGTVIGALTIQRDITARKSAEEALRESEERYRTIFQTAEVALLEVEFDQLKAALDKLREQGKRDWKKYLSRNPDFLTFAGSMLRVVDANRAAIKLFKAESKNTLLGEFPNLFSQPDSGVQRDFIRAIAEEHDTFQAEGAFSTIGAGKVHTLISLTIPRNEANFRNLLISLVDITERRKTEEEKDQLLSKLHQLNKQLETLAVTDGLTKLYNHRFFMETINREFSRSHRMGLSLALLIADIDDFKSFNDTYGHQLGDEILVKVSEVLSTARRGSDIVARYGGEEFVLLLPDTSLEQAVALAEKLREKVASTDIESKEGKLHVTISLGAYAMERSSLRNPKELLILADKALYRAKRAGKNRVCTIEEGAAAL